MAICVKCGKGQLPNDPFGAQCTCARAYQVSDAPRRRWSAKISLHADTHEALARVLESIATEVRERRMGRSISGGYDYGYNVDVAEDQEQTAERYQEQLDSFNEIEAHKRDRDSE